MKTIKTTKKEKEKYCEKCGTRMITRTESAEYWSPYWAFHWSYPKFDESTGKKNLVRVWECPYRKEKYRSFFGKIKYHINKEHSITAEKLF